LKHALSFDIEDWFHIVDIPALEDRSKWDDFSSIVEEKTDLILQILEKHDTKATFFVLGWIANKYPSISKKIAERGHEIGTHSFWHRKVYEMTPEAFYDDLQLSVEILQDQTGKKIKGFRAPSFSIIPGTEWAFDIIKDLGLSYDASLFPAKRGQGGYNVNHKPHILSNKISVTNLPELPMSLMGYGPVKFPFSGGGYLRFCNKHIVKYGFQKLEKKGVPGVVYLHPRDFAPDSPRVPMSLFRKFKSYIGLKTTRPKLEMLLTEFDFTTCEQVLKNWFHTDDLDSLSETESIK
jgi:polysaccharide deacetylase family protein (PEP-CTERM system associated)